MGLRNEVIKRALDVEFGEEIGLDLFTAKEILCAAGIETKELQVIKDLKGKYQGHLLQEIERMLAEKKCATDPKKSRTEKEVTAIRKK